MTEKKLKIWYGKEGDFLEVIFEQRDENGNVLGFSVMRVSALQDLPLEVAL